MIHHFVIDYVLTRYEIEDYEYNYFVMMLSELKILYIINHHEDKTKRSIQYTKRFKQ